MFKAVISALACLIMALPSLAQTPASTWNDALSAHVVLGDDGVARVNYTQLKANTAAQNALASYLEQFADKNLSANTPENVADWINIYNAATIQHILSRYPARSIRDGYLFGGPWKKVSIVINGQPTSLHAIEHDILRKTYDDPRIHYALNCASYGCPNLKPSLWHADTLSSDLDAAARAYINHPRGVTVTPSGLTLSRIFKWYRGDFGGNNARVLAHLKYYADEPLLSALGSDPRIHKYAYDWSLNDVR